MAMSLQKWNVEFDAGYCVPDVIVHRYVDDSWYNDAMPSFLLSQHIKLWVDHIHEDEREMQMQRFTVSDERDGRGGILFECESLGVLLAYLDSAEYLAQSLIIG